MSLRDDLFSIPNLNVTIRNHPKASFIFYNRLPKAGSSTMTAIIKSMSQRHGFIVDFYNKPHQKHFIPPEEAEELKVELLSRRKPMVYIRHLYWLQFKDHEKPIYINMVRDPVELFISNFYYMRRGFNKKNNTSSEWKWEMSESKRAETIEQCIETKGKTIII